jgi:hypothetical protein
MGLYTLGAANEGYLHVSDISGRMKLGITKRRNQRRSHFTFFSNTNGVERSRKETE